MVVALVRRFVLKRLKDGSFCETRARILLVVLRKQQYSRSGDHVIRLKDSVHGWLVEGSERLREGVSFIDGGRDGGKLGESLLDLRKRSSGSEHCALK